ncbi:FIG00553991: hypothetical protein [Cronobacter dublinensis 1210]|uniref:Uncharacterized protein n=1 Tax=Cronobacter dublinensis 1210 TaxID=1208656 RepID=A0ABM9Q3C9_9ENTR|nr:hypothetical protein [Cronobacter dublinensis]ALB68337.1 hypothetical protein AFK67_18380 [Cronobacter dublinensis subsp. dublinensis LMG 23823]MDI7273199.1 hypothetical protein [Cronobacter dublinensis]CCJ79873.1 FIG00553991: hypothetical protein [Cronobacter dublinensis 1210]
MSDLFNAVRQLLASPQFQKSAGKIVAEEFLGLLKEGLNDEETFIKTTAEMTAQAVLNQAQGLITEEDMTALLNKQKTIAQIHANSSEIALRTRIQTLTVRLIDIAIRSFSGAVN